VGDLIKSPSSKQKRQWQEQKKELTGLKREGEREEGRSEEGSV
jgi:hypothetical protein